MSTVESLVAEDNYDVFRHFEGGREGVKTRFGHLIKNRLDDYSFSEVMQFCEEAEVSPNELYEISKGNYATVSGDLVNRVINEFKICYDGGLGSFLINSEDIPRIMQQIKRDGIVIPCPAGVEVTDLNLCKMYLSCEAARQL